MYHVSIKLQKHEWTFGRTRNAVGTRVRSLDSLAPLAFFPSVTSSFLTKISGGGGGGGGL